METISEGEKGLIWAKNLKGRYRPNIAGFSSLVSFFLLLCMMFLSACSSQRDGFYSSNQGGNFTDFQAPEAQTVRVALLLPLSAPGETGTIAKAMKQAAEQALLEERAPGFSLITQDTRGTPQGARMAAEKAISQGAQLILGPLLASETQGAAALVRARSIPMVSFSSLSQVAGGGVYVLGFIPQSDVDEVVRGTASSGIQSYVALLPKTTYGSVLEKALARSVPQNRARLVSVHRYGADPQDTQSQVMATVSDLATLPPGKKALFLAESQPRLSEILEQLEQAGVDGASVQIIGTGLWNDPRIEALPALDGALYASTNPALEEAFLERYRTLYGEDPPRLASLAYDGVYMAMDLAKAAPQGPFTGPAMMRARGFSGVNGFYRFSQTGVVMRDLSVLRITAGHTQVMQQ